MRPELRCDVAVVGGGPVGLLLGCLLAQRGVDVRVLEKRSARSEGSRAVGVHPPGLSCLQAAGIGDALVAQAVRVQRASAFHDAGELGSVDFAGLPGPYPFVLTVPQHVTENLLEQRLNTLAPEALARDTQVQNCRQIADDLRVTGLQAGRPFHLRARYVIGCEGKRSVVREACGIPFRGGPYPAHFVMADTPDETPFGDAAAIFLTRAGLVESFPMPGGMRRWVVGLGTQAGEADPALVSRLVHERTGQRADPERATMVSAFRAERYLADRFVHGNAILAGDAAHVLSPIGGQGMNLGWLDAMPLSELLPRLLADPSCAAAQLAAYQRTRRRAARSAIWRAQAFMTVAARRVYTKPLTNFTVRALLSGPLKARSARLFTMDGLH